MVKRNEYVTVNIRTNEENVQCDNRGYPRLKQDTIQRRQDKGYLIAAKEKLSKQRSKRITFRSTFVTQRKNNYGNKI